MSSQVVYNDVTAAAAATNGDDNAVAATPSVVNISLPTFNASNPAKILPKSPAVTPSVLFKSVKNLVTSGKYLIKSINPFTIPSTIKAKSLPCCVTNF